MNALGLPLAAKLRSFWSQRPTPACWLLGGCLLLFGWALHSHASGDLDISRTGAIPLIVWSNTTATLQTATNPAGGWIDLPGAANPYLVSITNRAQFFRLRQPASSIPVITDIEPAYLRATGGVFYVLGTNFAPGTVALMNGAPAGSVTFINSNLLMVLAGGFSPGNYDLALVNGAQTNAMLRQGITVEASPWASLETPPGLPATVTPAGELRESFVDLTLPEAIGPPFTLVRTYRSRLGPTNSPLGPGWDFSANISIQTNGPNVIVTDGAGRADTFYRQPDGTYSRAGFFRQGAFAGGVFTLTFADQGRWAFNSLGAAIAPGKIAQAIDRNGNALTYGYNPSGQLTNVTDATGRSVGFAYNRAGQLTSVRDFTGRTVSYAYDVQGNLWTQTTPAVTGTPNGNDFPAGKTTIYTYDASHRLTSIIDPLGVVIETNQYSAAGNPAAADYAHLLTRAAGTNPPAVYSFEPQTPSPANRYATMKVYVNDPVGNVSAVLYDSRNRPVQMDEYTGRATPGLAVTAAANLPKNKLRAGDPAYFETTCSFNLDSLPVQLTEPRGNSRRMLYAGDANPTTPVRERGNLLTLTQTPAPGVPSDQAQITERFEYLTGFGTGESAAGILRHGGRHDTDRRPALRLAGMEEGSMLSGHLGYNCKSRPMGTACAARMPTRYIDPLGNVWNYSYDSHGNLTNALPPGVATGDSFEYNAVGQLTAHVHPADGTGYRQRDAFEYYTTGASKGLLKAEVCGTDGWGSGGSTGAALRTSYAYDAAGNVASVVDPRGNDTQFVFNQLDQLMQVKSAPGASGVRTQTDYQYSMAVILRAGHYQYQLAAAYDELVEEHLVLMTQNPLQQNASIEYQTSIEELDLTDGVGAANGRVVRVDQSHFDQDGNPIGDGKISTNFGYDAIGQLTSVTNALGGVVRYQYDAAGELTAALSPLASSGTDVNNRVQFQFDERGLPFQETSAPGGSAQSTTQYDYDANGNLSRISEGLEGTPQITTMESDGLAASARAFDFLQEHVLYSRLLFGTAIPTMLTVSDYALQRPPGVPRAIGLDTARGYFVKTRTDSDFNPKTGQMQAKSKGLARHRMPQVSDFPRTITDPLGNTTTNRFDACGNLVSTTIGSPMAVGGDFGFLKLAESSLGYDALGRLTNVTTGVLDPAGKSTSSAVTIAALADNGQLTSLTDPLGHTMSYSYDSVGRLSTASDPQDDSTTYTYDANGNVRTVSKRFKVELGRVADYVLTKSFDYDALNRCSSATDNVGNTELFAYDSLGNLVRHTDARGVVSQYEYDALSRLMRTGTDMDGDGKAVGMADLIESHYYDANSRLTSTRDRNGNATVFSYDSRNRLVQTVHPDATTNTLAYDVHNNVIAAWDANATVVIYSYDLNNRLTQKNILPAGGVAATTTREHFSYDGLGRLVQAGNDSSTNSFTYDSLGDVLTESQNGLTVTNTYDAVGNRLSMIYPGGRQIAYTYEPGISLVRDADLLLRRFKNRCNMTSAAGGAGDMRGATPMAEITYRISTVSLMQSTDGDTPRLLATHHYIGDLLERTDLANGIQAQYSYNGGVGATNATGDLGWGQISRIQRFASNGSRLEDISYFYDGAQNITGKVRSFPGGTLVRRYQYDAAGRLTNSMAIENGTQTRSITYMLDKADNRLSVTGDAHSGIYTLSDTTPEPADAQMNQYTTTPVGQFTYDRNGNRIAEITQGGAVRLYQYDYRNQLVGVVDGATGVHLADYGYDALGRRRLKWLRKDLAREMTAYVYDGTSVIEERDASGVVAVLTGRPEPGPKQKLLRALDAAVVVRRVNGTNYWPSLDNQGSTLALTLDNGTVAERYDYADYGEPTFFDGSGNPISGSAAGNPYLFGGMQYDSETGLYRRGHRRDGYYNIGHGALLGDPRIGANLQRGVGDPPAAAGVIQTRRAGKSSSGDGMRLD